MTIRPNRIGPISVQKVEVSSQARIVGRPGEPVVGLQEVAQRDVAQVLPSYERSGGLICSRSSTANEVENSNGERAERQGLGTATPVPLVQLVNRKAINIVDGERPKNRELREGSWRRAKF